ncbi:MAG: hypothetical protein VB996_00950, partial [Pseudomonadales bacterium]
DRRKHLHYRRRNGCRRGHDHRAALGASRHLQRRRLLTKAGGLVEVNVIEDPQYFVADDVLA